MYRTSLVGWPSRSVCLISMRSRRRKTVPNRRTCRTAISTARNVIGSLAADRSAILPSPVLLVDDMVDSRWTFTVAARLLRGRGSGVVWPIALADAAGTR